MIPEIDIWRAANLMVKRYGDKALEETSTRVDELTAACDHEGADAWRRISAAVIQLAKRHTTRTTALIGTHPKGSSVPSPVYS